MILNYLINIKCKKCGVLLKNVHYNTKYCNLCYNKKKISECKEYRRTHVIIPKIIYKTCLSCNSKFERTGRNQKYCSKCSSIVIRIRDYNEAKQKNPFHYCIDCKKIKLWFPNRHKYCPQCRIKNYKKRRLRQYKLHYTKFSIYQKQYEKNNPWNRVLRDIRQRCKNPNNHAYNYYGGRGIKNELTNEDIKSLWKKYKAYNMKSPQLHRKNNDKNYIKNNCIFIEKLDHEIIHLKMKLKKKIIERKIYE